MPRARMDLIGKRFGRLIVLAIAGTNTYGKALWKCKCECGSEDVLVTTKTLLHTELPSCGCAKKRDLTGQKFNYLTAMYPINDGARRVNWHWKCDCGNEVNIRGTYVTNGHTKSCGKCSLAKPKENLKLRKDITRLATSDIEVIARLPKKDNGVLPIRCKCNLCGSEFAVSYDALAKGSVKSCGCTYGSNLEVEVYDYIRGLVPEAIIERNYHIFKDKRSVDIYLPKYKLAIDVNGSVFHASLGHPFVNRESDFHFERFKELKANNIRLINLFDIDWGVKVKSILADILGSKVKIFARKCTCTSIDKVDANAFFDKYHLYGGNNLSKYHYGLYCGDELVSVMSFGKKRYSNGIEIIRYAVKSGYTILGGASKLFTHFIADNDIDEVFTYSDNDYFDGSIYSKLGFRFIGYTPPDYYWFHNGYGMLRREACQPRKLKVQFPELYNPNVKSIENDIMLKRKYVKVYRAGNSKWLWKRGDNI